MNRLCVYGNSTVRNNVEKFQREEAYNSLELITVIIRITQGPKNMGNPTI